ncbi:hypothetical protein N9P33_03415 [Gammaproteobacteria bacterium]|nr:hypothetical protein [Gammaproteobacteria bacterium]
MAFGWSYKSWSHAFKVSNFQLPNKVDKILEIGASEHSIVSLIFDGLASEIVISYYSDEQREGVEQYLASIRQKYNLKSKYVLEQIDATTVEGSFDIVIMKSVLGGLFRQNSSTISDVTGFIGSLVSRVVKPEGLLISIDNGKSILERTVSRFGARKNQWRLFRKSELNGAIRQTEFGVISSFSFETRLGYVGYILDNYVIYPIDLILFKFWSHNPTVIVSVFSTHD